MQADEAVLGREVSMTRLDERLGQGAHVCALQDDVAFCTDDRVLGLERDVLVLEDVREVRQQGAQLLVDLEDRAVVEAVLVGDEEVERLAIAVGGSASVGRSGGWGTTVHAHHGHLGFLAIERGILYIQGINRRSRSSRQSERTVRMLLGAGVTLQSSIDKSLQFRFDKNAVFV